MGSDKFFLFFQNRIKNDLFKRHARVEKASEYVKLCSADLFFSVHRHLTFSHAHQELRHRKFVTWKVFNLSDTNLINSPLALAAMKESASTL